MHQEILLIYLFFALSFQRKVLDLMLSGEIHILQRHLRLVFHFEKNENIQVCDFCSYCIHKFHVHLRQAGQLHSGNFWHHRTPSRCLLCIVHYAVACILNAAFCRKKYLVYVVSIKVIYKSFKVWSCAKTCLSFCVQHRCKNRTEYEL